MKLQSFQVVDYKSIIDSNRCWLSGDITVLAGKNESGKSSILEALRDFNSSNVVSEDAVRIWEDEKNKPKIVCYFSMTSDEIREITEEACWNEEHQEIVTQYLESQKSWLYVQKTGWTLTHLTSTWLAFESIWLNQLEAKFIELNNFVKENGLKSLKQSFNKNSLFSTNKSLFDKNIEQLKAYKNDTNSGTIDSFIQTINQEVLDVEKECVAHRNVLLQEINKKIPDIIFFSQFERWLEYEITLEEAKENPTVSDLCKIANINLDEYSKIKGNLRRVNYLATRSAKVTWDFKEYWKQDEIEIAVSPNNEDGLRFWIKETWGVLEFTSKQRSQWFKWFLDFYLRLKAHGVDESNWKIILIDEPWLFLHAKAQTDVLDVLKNLSNAHQIIFSTHSPYLIDPSSLERVRLIEKDDLNWTKILSINAGASSSDTLTPIITALGYSLNIGLLWKKAVICEWISDYYYLTSMKKLLKNTNNSWDTIPCIGATTIDSIVSIQFGWGIDFKVILDNDSAGQGTEERLIKEWVDEEKILYVSDTDWFAIEDIFTREDFNKFVLSDDEEKVPEGTSNSKFIKQKKYQKTLIAKKFSESKNKVQLSKETKDNFKSIIDKLYT